MQNNIEVNYNLPNDLETFIHDLTSPLTNIGLNLQLIQKQFDIDPRIRNSLKSAESSVNYLHDLIRLNRPAFSVNASNKFSVNELIDDFVNKKFMAILNHLDIALTYELNDSIHLYGNKQRLEQVISNIFSNSIDALSTSKKKYKYIRVTGFVDTQIFLSIEDNGCGISRNSLKSVFSPHYTTKNDHSGIGLAICRKIITEEFNGRITLTSKYGSGTKIKLCFPFQATKI